MERLDETIERILCSDPYGHRPAGPTHEASRRVLGRRRAVATGAADRHVRRKRARLRHRGDGRSWADGACPSQGDRRTLMAVRHPDICGRALHGRSADDGATDDLRQPATSSVCSFDSTRTERTASTCSAGRNSSACSSTATGTTWSATAAGAHGEPIPSTRPCGSRTSSRSWATGRSSTRSRRSQRLIAIGVDRSVWLDARGEDGSGPLVGPVQRAWVHGPVRRPVEPFRPVLPVADAGLGQRAARPAAARASVGAVAVVALVVRGPAGPHGGAGAPAEFALRQGALGRHSWLPTHRRPFALADSTSLSRPPERMWTDAACPRPPPRRDLAHDPARDRLDRHPR